MRKPNSRQKMELWNSLIVPKNVNADPFGFFYLRVFLSTFFNQCVAKYRKIDIGTFGGITKFSKKSHWQKKRKGAL